MKTGAKTKSFFSFLVPVFILTGFFVWGFSAKVEASSHIVISEIQTAGATATDEFVELYNPTDLEVDISGWKLQYKSAAGTTWSSKTADGLPSGSMIAPHKFFLLSGKDYTGSIEPNYRHAANWGLADSAGHVRIINNTGSGDEVDKVGYGSSVDSAETASVPAPPASQSIERKANYSSTAESMSVGGTDEYLGNGWDSDNNSADFVLRLVSNPQNASSAAEQTVENSQTSDSAPAQTPPVTPSAFSSGIKNVPTAEAGADKAAVVGEIVEFDGSDSFDLAGKELTYRWTFGDGAKASGAAVSHAYQVAGQYAATLKVDNGENTAEDSSTIKISEPEFSDKIIISEILPNPVGADKDGEWIELANLGGKKINLRGWILEAKTKTGAKQYVFSGDNFFEPNGYLLVKRSQSSLVLPNAGGEVNLLLPPNKNLVKVSYGEAKEDKSYALIDNNWQWTDVPTPAKENILEVIDKTTKTSVEGKNIVAAAPDSNNIALPESRLITDEEIFSAPNSAGKKQEQNSAVQLVAVSDLEKYLGKAIEDKISAAVSGLVIKSAEPAEKVSAPENPESLLGSQSAFAADEAAAPVQQSKKDGAKDDPWFYSSLTLSGLSLFLLWRLWKLKKKTIK